MSAALDTGDRALAVAPDDEGVTLFVAAVLAVMDRDRDRAYNLLKKVAKSMPEVDPFYVMTRGLLALRAGQYEEAVTLLRQGLQELPPDPLALEALGDAYAALGRKDDAISAWRKGYGATSSRHARRRSLARKFRRARR